MEKPKLRAVGNPRNIYNSIRSVPLLLLYILQPILAFLWRSANRNVIILWQDFPLVVLVCLLFKVIHTGLVLQAFPSQLTVRSQCEIPQPILTSTPIASKAASNHLTNSSETSKTVLSVQYPSKTMNKTLCGSYQTIGKALAHGVPSQIANAVTKNPTLKNHVMENVLKTLSKEVVALCSKANPSILIFNF